MANITGTSGNDTRVGTSGMDDIINRDGDPQGFPGTRGNDVLFGYGGADFIYGGPHNDQLFGGTGNDRLFGGTGNDLLKGGVNNDLLNGGLGTDTADYSTVSIDPPGPVGPILTIGATAGVTVNLNMQGVAQNTGGAGLDMLVGIENLIGTNFNDTLTGSAGNNVLLGLVGNDTLNAGAGTDLLYGGAGADTLNGGLGNDTFDYNAAGESTFLVPFSADLITDFQDFAQVGANHDFIDLQDVAPGTFVFLGLVFAPIFNLGFTGGGTASVRYAHSLPVVGPTVIQGDSNGDGIQDMEIILTGLHSLQAADFLL